MKQWLFLLMALPLFGLDYLILQENYTFERQQIFAQDLVPIKENFLLFEIPKSMHRYQIKSSQLISLFEKQGIQVGANAPLITFQKKFNTNTQGIKKHISSLFLEEYSAYNFQIKNLEIEQITPADFDSNAIGNIYFKSPLLKKNEGTFYITTTTNQQEKKIFFKYHIEASLEGIFTTDKLSGGSTLYESLITIKRIPFDKITSPLMQKGEIGKVALKSYTPKDILITKNRLIGKRAVNKGEKVLIRVNEDGVILEFLVIAQKNAAIGDIIKAKALSSKKIYTIQIIDEGVGKLL